MKKLVGTCKWFNAAKGYGFISTPDGDAMVHHRAILMDGFKTLREGQQVRFVVTRSERGLQAHEVEPIETEPA